MRQISRTLTVLGGLLLVTSVACTDQTTPRAPRATAVIESTPEALTIESRQTYTVAPGDFLWEIAARFEVSLDELVALNDIEDIALIEVGQVLTIPGGETVLIADPFEIATGEHWPEIYTPENWAEIYPPQELPPPAEPTAIQELRDRIAAWPWPPQATMVQYGVIGGFALVALVAGLLLTNLEYNARRWIRRDAPRSYRAVRRRTIAVWTRTVAAVNAVGRVVRAVGHRYRQIRTLVILGWARTSTPRERIAERSRPALERAADLTRDRSRQLIDAARDRAPAAVGGIGGLGERASTSVRRTVRSGADRARREGPDPASPSDRWRTRIAGELANAFERRQLQVRYVPVIDLDARTLSAVEAHIFWQHPQRGLMSARDISSATHEHPELGAALLEFLLEQSCTFVKEQVDTRFPSAQLIVPVTLEQIVESEPLAAIDRGLTSANLAIDRLKISVAEPHALQDSATAATFIRNLRSMGIGVHLDDYGMAQASDLRRLGVSSVTVDFTAAGSGDAARSILTAAVQAAQELRLPVTARHARTQAAQALQASLGCSFEAIGQPIPADAFVSTHVAEKPREAPAAPAASTSAATKTDRPSGRSAATASDVDQPTPLQSGATGDQPLATRPPKPDQLSAETAHDTGTGSAVGGKAPLTASPERISDDDAGNAGDASDSTTEAVETPQAQAAASRPVDAA